MSDNRLKDLFGFGCMRLPMKGDEVDHEQFNQMIDLYMDAGFNYFDTAHGYISGKSETAIRDCLVARYPRESYRIVNKLSGYLFNEEADIRPFFEKQLKQTGVEYFDYYFMHAQDRGNYEQFKRTRAYEIAQELKAEGKIKHVGISFHDNAEMLERILTDHPEIEVVQIQFNYMDYYDASIQSKEVYEVCRKHNKPMAIMEPAKGGALVKLPDDAKAVFDALGGGSYASYANRFAGSFDGVVKVVSGMSALSDMEDNLSYMKDFKPFTQEEFDAVEKVKDILKALGGVACTACGYCVDDCPMDIPIPEIFSAYNAKLQFNDWNSGMYYNISTKNKGKASDCIECGACEAVCPQHLPIIEDLQKVVETFEQP
ncbi:MAG: aldo/keto reductase [Turicibacter sp.]|nr:aldo/keto reductase [Turicibacter sp.]